MCIKENVVSGLVPVFRFTQKKNYKSKHNRSRWTKKVHGKFRFQHTTYNGTTQHCFLQKKTSIKFNIKKKSEKKSHPSTSTPDMLDLQNLGFGRFFLGYPSRGKAKKLDHRTTPGQVHPPPDPTWNQKKHKKKLGSQGSWLFFCTLKW